MKTPILVRSIGTLLLLGGAVIVTASAQPPAAPNRMIKQGAMQGGRALLRDPRRRVAFVPNVGIVVGDKATSTVDTGLGEANGAIGLREARTVSITRSSMSRRRTIIRSTT